MSEMRELYDTALFDIAQTMQSTSFHFEKINCRMDDFLREAIYLKPAVITARMRATLKLRRSIVRMLACNVTQKSIQASVHGPRIKGATTLAPEYVKIFVAGGIEKILEAYLVKFATTLIESGVRHSTAWGIASHVLLRREETIVFLNATDDTGQTELLCKPSHL